MKNISRSIPEKLHQQIMNWHAEGMTGPKIADMLKSKYNVDVSMHTVYRLMQRIRKTRQESAKMAYATEIAQTAAEDIKIMSDVVSTYYTEWKTCQDPSLKLKLAAELRSWVKDKMVLSGLDKDTFISDVDAAKDEFMDELNKLKSIN